MRDLLIYGAGGLARELVCWIQQDLHTSWRIQALVTDRLSEQGDYDGIPVLSRATALQRFDKPEYLLGFASPTAKQQVATELAALGWRAARYVHPSALVASSAQLAEGVVVCPLCTVSPLVQIGAHVLVNAGTGIGHDSRIGAFSSLLGRVSINGDVHLGESVLVGANATVINGRRVGDHVTIGIGSVVVSHVQDAVTVFGNPARRVRT